MKDFTSSIPSAEDIIRALGLQGHAARTDVMPGLALFGAGILVGAGLALLFAPTSGRELRENIGEQVNEMRERMGGDGHAESDRPAGAAA